MHAVARGDSHGELGDAQVLEAVLRGGAVLLGEGVEEREEQPTRVVDARRRLGACALTSGTATCTWDEISIATATR